MYAFNIENKIHLKHEPRRKFGDINVGTFSNLVGLGQ